MASWNPFGKVDMEIGSFLKESVFNKEYVQDDRPDKENQSEDKPNEDK
jgi:hypothetical protein